MPRSEKVTRVRHRGTTEYRDEAKALLEKPGDVVLVERGVPRSFVMRCPDGCGETLAINLDRRAGKAWRLQAEQNSTVSLYPSVWKADGCRSHFIVRKSRIIWCEPEAASTSQAVWFDQGQLTGQTPVEVKGEREASVFSPDASPTKHERSWIARGASTILTALKNFFR